MNDSSEFKADLVDFLMERINHEELNDKFGCSLDFIAQGMIESIASSIRIANLAKKIPKDFDTNAS